MYAFALLNGGNDGTPSVVSIKLSDMGLNSSTGYNITEVFDGTVIGKFLPKDTFTMSIFPTSVFFGKAVPIAPQSKAVKQYPSINNVHKWQLL